jgi:uncharacterized protein YmfQ (DUF2313 family)
MTHADLLKLLMPSSMDAQGESLSAELIAEGNALDAAQYNADQILIEADPTTAVLTLDDWERVYGLPDGCTLVRTLALSAGMYGEYTITDIATFARASVASYIDSAGIMRYASANIPRFSYSLANLGAAPVLLLESAATNLLSYSSQFDNAFWNIKTLVSIISGAAISPDGSQNANLITLFPSAPNGYFGYLTSAGSYANKTLVFSMFLKLGTLTSTVTLYLRDSIGNSYGMAIFDLNAGTYVSGGVGAWGIVSAGSGFWRVYVSGTFPAGAGAGIACLVDPNDESANAGQTFYAFGAQLEYGSVPSSYIPTTTAPVTRPAEVCSVYVPPTLSERRSALVSKVNMRGGQSRDFYINLAAQLGYTITIDELAPDTTEFDTESATTDEQWQFIFQVNASSVSVVDMTSEDDTEMATAVWGNQQLECGINKYKPAHTFALFSYT